MLIEGPYDVVPQKIQVLKKWKFDQTTQLQVVMAVTTDGGKWWASSETGGLRVTVFVKGSMEAVAKLCGRRKERRLSAGEG